MDRETQAAMRDIGWTWSPSGQHFHRSADRTHRLISCYSGKWVAESYDWNWNHTSDWRSDQRFDTPFAALAYAEVDGWGES